MGEILIRRQMRGEEAGSKPEPLCLPLTSQDPLPELSGQIAPVAKLTAEPDRRGSDTDGLRVETPQGTLLIQGDSILCPCPECNSPLSIRLWLLIVDCWNCGSAVELSEEQLAAIDQALQQKALSAQGVRPRGQTPGSDPLGPAPSSRPIESPAEPDLPSSSPLLPPGRQPPQTTTVTQRSPKTTTKVTSALDLDPAPRPFRLGPAWILSLLFHLLLLLLLTLITFQQTDLWESITISTYLDEADTEGGDIEQLELSPELTDLPPPPLENLSPEEVRDVLVQADQDARQLQIDPDPNVPLPAISEVRGRLDAPPGTVSSFAARDPRLRSEIVKQEGGTLLTEAAVSRGLRWLAEHQNRDGSWSLRDFERASDPNNQGDPAGTSLALLPFLGAGQTHEYGVYKDQVGRGLRWLIQQQKPDGDLRGNLDDARGMYAHGQGTIVLVEALAMTGDERFRIPAQKAIDFIVAAQHDEGGWRYRPREAGDTSVLGWQLMALQSARTPGTGLRVPDETLRLASYYLDLCASENGSRYSYQPGQRGQPTPSMTAEALLCRMYLGWTGDDPRLRAGLNWLEREHAPKSTRRNIYYWYYATQIFHHAGGPAWDRWNVEMRDLLVNAQVKRGEHAGSWHPDEYEFGQQGGRIFTTSLGVCILEVYYRHLPLFKRLDLGEGEGEATPAE